MSPDRWLRLDVELRAADVPPEALYALTECLVAAGSNGTQQEADRCVTYFAVPSDLEAFKADAEARVEDALGYPALCRWGWQPHEEWADVWRQGFAAHDFGARLRVAPPWIEAPPAGDRSVVLIDPGVAFGTAEHGSTRSCLHFLEREVNGGERVLDVGAGSGVLAIAAVKLGAESAVCVELDVMACQALRENAVLNGVGEQIEVIEGGFGDDVAPDIYHVVVCNMVRTRLVPFLPALGERVGSGGLLLLGGIQAEERERIAEDLSILGRAWSTPQVHADSGWLSVLLTRL